MVLHFQICERNLTGIALFFSRDSVLVFYHHFLYPCQCGGGSLHAVNTEICEAVRHPRICGADKNGDDAGIWGKGQRPNAGGQPYWSWYGFNGRVEWCACFGVWCADQCGYLESGIIPKFSLCSDGVNRRGQFWRCLQAAKLSGREQLNLRLWYTCLLGKW